MGVNIGEFIDKQLVQPTSWMDAYTDEQFEKADYFINQSGKIPGDLSEQQYKAVINNLDLSGDSPVVKDYKRVNKILGTNYSPTPIVAETIASVKRAPGNIKQEMLYPDMGYSVPTSEDYSDPMYASGTYKTTPESYKARSLVEEKIDSIKEVAKQGADEAAVNTSESGNVNVLRNLSKKYYDDIIAGGLVNAAVGTGSVALSQMQGQGVVGTGLNLAGAMAGSALGNRYLNVGNAALPRGFGGLAGHAAMNIVSNLFKSSPQEDELLNQGMMYQNQNGGY